jgi:hypothetical protein
MICEAVDAPRDIHNVADADADSSAGSLLFETNEVPDNFFVRPAFCFVVSGWDFSVPDGNRRDYTEMGGDPRLLFVRDCLSFGYIDENMSR